ncbi:centrosomal protein 43 isoform X1 [Pteronotus mesoamericanus]|uniref:centrosomal protein 43 isoform X1 n=1 Tax=Pteronotus mesoamericanus TaxID=1884717 RepID=UPI0023ECC437|nr:centrosomal protein 43 isoform X1 [Pteronotus parnellii mesoamericanus]
MAATAAPVVAEEDTELRDLLVQTLENSGVLNRIKAELRAAVFLALEEQEKIENKTPLVNESLKKFLNTKDGRLVASLVAEFLQFFNLDFTLAVFQPETSTFQGLEGRENLARDLGIAEAEGAVGAPLLLEVIRRCQQKGSGGAAGQKASSEASPSETSTSLSEPKGKSSLQLPAPEPKTGSFLNSKSLGGGDEAGLGPQDDDTDGDSFFDDPAPRPEEACGWRSAPGERGGSLASLSDAPPLQSGRSALAAAAAAAGAPSWKDAESKRENTVLRDLKLANDKLGSLGLGAGEGDDYVDDFNSTSHRSEKSELSIGEEIEEDLSVGLDDANTSDKLDDRTQDLTVSQLSDVADYLEDVACA